MDWTGLRIGLWMSERGIVFALRMAKTRSANSMFSRSHVKVLFSHGKSDSQLFHRVSDASAQPILWIWPSVYLR